MSKGKYEGIALEMDVMKKMGKQLQRLNSVAAKQRVAEYVAQAAGEVNPPPVPHEESNGQLEFSPV